MSRSHDLILKREDGTTIYAVGLLLADDEETDLVKRLEKALRTDGDLWLIRKLSEIK